MSSLKFNMDIVHDSKKQEFYIDLDFYHAVLLYASHEKILDFYHVYVPDPFRNQGIAAKLLIHAFEYAKTEGFQVVPSCPFIAGDFLKRFPQYQEIVRPGEFLFVHEKQS